MPRGERIMPDNQLSLENQPSLSTDVHREAPLHRRDFLKMAAAVGGTALTLNALSFADKVTTTTTVSTKARQSTVPANHPQHVYDPTETIQAKAFPNLSTVEGISQNQLNQHLELYNGYVKKINDIQSQIAASVPDIEKMNPTYSPYRALHVEQSYALNGVVLHEAYFESLGGERLRAEQCETLQRVITAEFGNWDNYQKHLAAVAKSARGWAVTAYNMRDHRVHNYGLDLHNQTVPMYVMPLLVLDVYEHAYMIDFGTRRAAYLDQFFQNVNWQIVENRLNTMILHG